MSNTGYDPMKPWFLALESMGEFIGMRLARIPPGKSEPDWIYVPHSECDGFAVIKKLFAERGGIVEALPQARHPAKPSVSSFFKLMKMQMQPRWRLHWKDLGASRGKSDPCQPAPAVAWHVFEEDQTLQMRQFCNAAGGTVNSFLLRHLTAALRPCLVEGEEASVPWMIPVNMRGRVVSAGEMSNHVSYVTVVVRPGNTSREIHQSTQAAMDREEHCTNWFAYSLGKYMPQKMKRFLIAKELATPQWYLGAFTNLGAWDSEKKITSPDCLGAWLATALVFRFQPFGAGCFTFQNRMSLCVQAHPELTTDPEICRTWIKNWVNAIQSELENSGKNISSAPQKKFPLKI
ncbi:MAG TPA: hypothetical protein VHG71_11020 [Verrucomicrobiae bacterium]|nr:hypothetical protein [Verrucomicrobiae bacterium]